MPLKKETKPEYSPMDPYTVVHSEVESYQSLKKWYMMPPT